MKNTSLPLSILYLIPFALLIYLGLCAFLNFDTSWDYTAYHLPHALRLYGLTSYLPNPFLIAFSDGAPPAAHYIQGGMVWLTGRMSTANSQNFMAVLTLIAYTTFRLNAGRESLLVFLLLLLSIPLVLTQILSGYIDIWACTWVSIAFLEAVTPRPVEGQKTWIFFSSLLLAMLSKYQNWPACILISLLYFINRRQEWHENTKKMKIHFCCVAFILAFWPVRNLLTFQNPTYPFKTPVIGFLFKNYKAELSGDLADIPEIYRETPRPIRFLISSLEISRLAAKTPMKWTYGQWEDGPKNPNNCMGGWSFTTFTIILLLLGRLFRLNKKVILEFFILIVLTSILPESHELRYWLYVPLIGILLIAVLMEQEKNLPPLKGALLLLLLLGNIFYVYPQAHPTLEANKSPADYAPEKAKEFWKTALPKASGKEYGILSMPDSIFYAGPEFNSFLVRD